METVRFDDTPVVTATSLPLKPNSVPSAVYSAFCELQARIFVTFMMAVSHHAANKFSFTLRPKCCKLRPIGTLQSVANSACES